MESLFGSSATAAAADTAASSTVADTAATSAAADTAATAVPATTAFDTTGGAALGGTGEFATGVTAADLASTGAGTGATLAAAPSFLDQITSAYQSVSPYVDTASKILQTGNMLKNAISGAGTPATGSANTPSPAAATTSTPPDQNQMKRDDYIKQQEAYWQNLLAAQGNILPGNQLPPNIQDAIRRQASIYPA